MNTVRSGLLLLLTATIGCGDGRVGLPTAPVAGTVTYQGKPLASGRILFLHPSGQGAAADIAADGTFKLTAFQGKNQVVVACFTQEPPNPDPKAPFARPQQGKSLIPDRYNSCNTSDLSFDVEPDKDNRADITLKD